MSVSTESASSELNPSDRVKPDGQSEESDLGHSTSASRSSAATRGREATRQRLLEAGRLVFPRHGLHGVTAHDIAHRAELASGTFYLHFKNKRELFREIVDTSVGELIERLHEAFQPFIENRDRHGIVTAQANAMMSFAEENREMIRMVFSADSDAAAVGSDVLQRLATVIAEDRRDLIATGVVGTGIDPEVLGQAVVGMWAQVLSWWADDPDRVTRESLVNTLTQIQLAGTEPT